MPDYTTDLKKLKEIVLSDVCILLRHFDIDCNFRRSGKHQLSCPIHSGDNQSALSLDLNTGYWKCWTKNCHDEYGKDIFGLTRGLLEANGQASSFIDALNLIKKIYKVNGDNLRKLKTSEEEDSGDYFSGLVKSLKNKAKSKHEKKILDPIPTNEYSLYFESRGFKEDTLRYFGVADSKSSKYKMENRSVIPIHDISGDLIAYAGRATKDYIEPKFLFTEGFRKSDVLYNLNRAIESIIASHAIILVEGQSDVWRLYECGIKNAVGLFGKELTEGHVRILKSLNITKVAIFTDDDQPGRESKFFIQRQLGRTFSLVFPSLTKKDPGDMTVEEHINLTLPQIKGYY